MRRGATTVVASGAPRWVLWSRGRKDGVWTIDARTIRAFSSVLMISSRIAPAWWHGQPNEKSKPDSGSEIHIVFIWESVMKNVQCTNLITICSLHFWMTVEMLARCSPCVHDESNEPNNEGGFRRGTLGETRPPRSHASARRGARRCHPRRLPRRRAGPLGARSRSRPPPRRPARLPATPWRMSPPRSGARARRSSAWGARSWRRPPQCFPVGSSTRTATRTATACSDRTTGATTTISTGRTARLRVRILRRDLRDRGTWTSARSTRATS